MLQRHSTAGLPSLKSTIRTLSHSPASRTISSASPAYSPPVVFGADTPGMLPQSIESMSKETNTQSTSLVRLFSNVRKQLPAWLRPGSILALRMSRSIHTICPPLSSTQSACFLLQQYPLAPNSTNLPLNRSSSSSSLNGDPECAFPSLSGLTSRWASMLITPILPPSPSIIALALQQLWSLEPPTTMYFALGQSLIPCNIRYRRAQRVRYRSGCSSLTTSPRSATVHLDSVLILVASSLRSIETHFYPPTLPLLRAVPSSLAKPRKVNSACVGLLAKRWLSSFFQKERSMNYHLEGQPSSSKCFFHPSLPGPMCWWQSKHLPSVSLAGRHSFRTVWFLNTRWCTGSLHRPHRRKYALLGHSLIRCCARWGIGTISWHSSQAVVKGQSLSRCASSFSGSRNSLFTMSQKGQAESGSTTPPSFQSTESLFYRFDRLSYFALLDLLPSFSLLLFYLLRLPPLFCTEGCLSATSSLPESTFFTAYNVLLPRVLTALSILSLDTQLARLSTAAIAAFLTPLFELSRQPDKNYISWSNGMSALVWGINSVSTQSLAASSLGPFLSLNFSIWSTIARAENRGALDISSRVRLATILTLECTSASLSSSVVVIIQKQLSTLCLGLNLFTACTSKAAASKNTGLKVSSMQRTTARSRASGDWQSILLSQASPSSRCALTLLSTLHHTDSGTNLRQFSTSTRCSSVSFKSEPAYSGYLLGLGWAGSFLASGSTVFSLELGFGLILGFGFGDGLGSIYCVYCDTEVGILQGVGYLGGITSLCGAYFFVLVGMIQLGGRCGVYCRGGYINCDQARSPSGGCVGIELGFSSTSLTPNEPLIFRIY